MTPHILVAYSTSEVLQDTCVYMVVDSIKSLHMVDCYSTCVVTSYSHRNLLCCVFTVICLQICSYQILKVVIATEQRKNKLT